MSIECFYFNKPILLITNIYIYIYIKFPKKMPQNFVYIMFDILKLNTK